MLEKVNQNIFESIKHIDQFGNEYWYARELMPILQYNLWQNFHKIIRISMDNCIKSHHNVLDHFIDINKMVRIVQTDSKLKNDKIKGQKNANDTHYKIGKNIRNTILKNGATLPENLPTPNKSLKELERDKCLTEE